MTRTRSPSPGPRKAAIRGVTLIELLTVITIAAILMSAGVTSYQYVTNSNRTTAEVNGLLGDLQFARGEAIKEGTTVTACVSADGATCSALASNWESPFAKTGSSDTFDADNAVSAVTFNREGFASNVANASLFTLHTATADSRWTRCLSITTVGLMATARHGGATPAGNCA
jgi:type IV fimbrial biogenesis protein FimT